jgi:hypothetical protein
MQQQHMQLLPAVSSCCCLAAGDGVLQLLCIELCICADLTSYCSCCDFRMVLRLPLVAVTVVLLVLLLLLIHLPCRGWT